MVVSNAVWNVHLPMSDKILYSSLQIEQGPTMNEMAHLTENSFEDDNESRGSIKS